LQTTRQARLPTLQAGLTLHQRWAKVTALYNFLWEFAMQIQKGSKPRFPYENFMVSKLKNPIHAENRP